jgi:halimadienyl-diphosphate synthase
MDELIFELIKNMGQGKMSNLAYDTAWAARLGEVDWDISKKALEWLSENQLPDGTWGAEKPFYYHDRVISTLAAMIALTNQGRRMHDRTQIEKGLLALERITDGATQGLQADPNGSTVGFELLAPTLVANAEKLGIIKQQGDRILGRMTQLRAIKMEKLRGRRINRNFTAAFSAEMAGADHHQILDLDNIQEKNGSVGNSPSATAYFVTNLKKGDIAGVEYLKKWISQSGGMPDVAPFDVFEPAWILWNLKISGELNDKALKLCEPHLNFLQNSWQIGLGIGNSANAPKDGDDTGLVHEVLSSFGRKLDLESVFYYEEEEYFRCFDLEANPSVSANIHILGALQQAEYDAKHPSVVKALNFVRKSQLDQKYWMDKWHISPFYATSHAVICCRKFDSELCERAINWIIESQNPNGSWGFYRFSSAEETAYCLQALSIWNRFEKKVPKVIMQSGYEWLIQHQSPPYQPLWIGKGLYCPESVVHSAILSALTLTQ